MAIMVGANFFEEVRVLEEELTRENRGVVTETFRLVLGLVFIFVAIAFYAMVLGKMSGKVTDTDASTIINNTKAGLLDFTDLTQVAFVVIGAVVIVGILSMLRPVG